MTDLQKKLKKKAEGYILDYVEPGMPQRKIDDIVKSISQVTNRIEAKETKLQTEFSQFAKSFDGIKAGVMDVDLAVISVQSSRSLEIEIKSLKLILSILEDAKTVAERKADKNGMSAIVKGLVNEVKKEINK